jgi:hypothetical protein
MSKVGTLSYTEEGCNGFGQAGMGKRQLDEGRGKVS